MHWCICLEFDTSSVWRRLALNLIEFIQSKVWRSFDSACSVKFCKQLDNNDIGRSLQNALAFVLKLFSGKSSFRSRKYSKLNVYIDDFTVIQFDQFLWCEKMIKFTPKRVVDNYLKKQWNISKVPSQSTSHTHRSSGRAEAADRAGFLTNNLLPFQNSVRIAAQHSPP